MRKLKNRSELVADLLDQGLEHVCVVFEPDVFSEVEGKVPLSYPASGQPPLESPPVALNLLGMGSRDWIHKVFTVVHSPVQVAGLLKAAVALPAV